MKKMFLVVGVAGLLCGGCASDSNKGGTTPFTNPAMESKVEMGPQTMIGPDPMETSPSQRNLPSKVPDANAPDRGDKGHFSYP